MLCWSLVVMELGCLFDEKGRIEHRDIQHSLGIKVTVERGVVEGVLRRD